MKNWIDSEFFGFWQETHNRVLNSLSKLPNPLDFQGDLNLGQQPNVKFLNAWGESAVKQLLDLQTSWLQQWAERSKLEADNLEVFSSLMDQVNESMEKWTQTQKELWEFWFTMLDTRAEFNGVSDQYGENLDRWKAAVEESLVEQTNWLTKWQEQINCKPLVPEELDQLADKLSEAMQGWIQNQSELWQYGFDVINTASTVSKPPPRAKPKRPASVEIRDDLSAISGIGPALEKKLNAQGIVNYRQIADLNDEDIDRLEKTVIRFPGRIRREDWVGQAKKLCTT